MYLQYRWILVFVFVGLFSYPIQGQIDSLKSALMRANSTQRVLILNELSNQLQKSDLIAAQNYALEAINVSQQIGDSVGLANAYRNYGNVHWYKSQYSVTISYYIKALHLYEGANDTFGIAAILNNIGGVYKQQKDYKEAQKYYLKALKIIEELKDVKRFPLLYSNLADVYFGLEMKSEALNMYQKALQSATELNVLDEIIIAERGLGAFYTHEGNISKAKECYENALLTCEKTGDRYYAVSCLNSLAEIYLLEKSPENAIVYFNKALQFAHEADLKQSKKQTYEGLAKAYSQKEDYNKAYEFHTKYSLVSDSIFTEENAKLIEQLRTTYTLEQAQHKVVIDQKEAELKSIKTYLFSLAILLIIISTFSVYFIRKKYIDLVKRTNFFAAEENKFAETTHNQENQINKLNLQASKNIFLLSESKAEGIKVNSLLVPSKDDLDTKFSDSFILNRPKNSISGDFVWMKSFNGWVFWGVIDCYGHDISASIVTTYVHGILTEALFSLSEPTPAKILEKVHTQLFLLNDSVSCSYSPIEIGLCALSPKQTTVLYSGSKRPLIYHNGHQLIEIKGCSKVLGSPIRENETFQDTTINLGFTPYSFYLFSDGITNQIGGSSKKRFGLKQLAQKLENRAMLPMKEQKDLFTNDIIQFIRDGNEIQLDDILLMGVRIFALSDH